MRVADYKRLICIGFSLILFSGRAVAQMETRQQCIENAKVDIEQLYQQWAKGAGTSFSDKSFNQYLAKNRIYKRMASPPLYNSFTGRIDDAKYILPRGAWILDFFTPDSPAKIGLYIDLNGTGQPNGYQFQEKSDQIKFEIDSQGHVTY